MSPAPSHRSTLSHRLALVLAGAMAACAPADPNAPVSGATCPEGSTLSYETFGRDFFTNYCVRCHSASLSGEARNGAPDDHNFESVEQIRTMRLHIDLVAGSGPRGTGTAMPPEAPAPTLEERKKLAEWLACVAP